MTRSQQTTQHFTPHATLAAIGMKIRSLKLFDTTSFLKSADHGLRSRYRVGCPGAHAQGGGLRRRASGDLSAWALLAQAC